MEGADLRHHLNPQSASVVGRGYGVEALLALPTQRMIFSSVTTFPLRHQQVLGKLKLVLLLGAVWGKHAVKLPQSK